MRLNKGEMIGGRPALKVRDQLRASRDLPKEVQNALVDLGYITLDKEGHYEITDRGMTFTNASAAPPIPRARADMIVEEMLQRAHQINRNNFAFKVDALVVFGSYVSESPTVNDVDVAFRLRPIMSGAEQDKLENERRKLAEGRSGSFIDRLFWPKHEVRLKLKARVRGLSLHAIDDFEKLLRKNDGLAYKVLLGNWP